MTSTNTPTCGVGHNSIKLCSVSDVQEKVEAIIKEMIISSPPPPPPSSSSNNNNNELAIIRSGGNRDRDGELEDHLIIDFDGSNPNHRDPDDRTIQSSDLALLIHSYTTSGSLGRIELIDVVVEGDLSLIIQALANSCQLLWGFSLSNCRYRQRRRITNIGAGEAEEEEKDMMTPLLPALIQLNKLSHFEYCSFSRRDGWKLGTIALPVILKPNQILQKIDLQNFCLDFDDSMNRLLAACEQSSTLEELTLLPNWRRGLPGNLFDRISSKLMRKLKYIYILVFKNVDILASAKFLKNNQILEQFLIRKTRMPYGANRPESPEKEIKAFYKVLLEDNYKLKELRICGGEPSDSWDPFEEEDHPLYPYWKGIRCMLRLNELGRSKLLFDSTSAGEWIDVIFDPSNQQLDIDVSNLYNFLRKNPSLCVPTTTTTNQEKKKEEEDVIMGRRKRRREEEEQTTT